jgi:hypothetical protein
LTRVTVVTITGQVVTGHPPHWVNCPHAREFKNKRPDKTETLDEVKK